MPLRRKLLLSMLIPALLLGIVGAIGVYSLLHLEQAAGRILADNYHSIQEARRMAKSLRYLEAVDFGVGTGAGQSRDRPIAVFDEALRRCESNITEPGETSVLRSIHRTWRHLRSRHAVPEDMTTDQSRMHLRDFESLYADIDELVSLNEQAMISYEQETRHVARMMLAAVSGTALTAIITLALFALASAYWISRPVTEVADRLHQALNPMPQGTPEPGTRTVDEIARLREELAALLERLARYEDEQNRKLSYLQGRLAFVMNEVLEGLVLMDAKHRILAANRVARTILGMAVDEGLLIEELKPRADVREMLAPVIDGTFQPERDLGEVHYELDGSERIYRPRVLTVPGPAGDIEGYLILFWDVTEQRRFEESRRRFISMLSHQLKTPMTSLSMSVNLLKEKLRDAAPAQAELLSIATENCNSLAALVSDLIEAARESTPDLSLKPQYMDIGPLLRSALRPLVPQAEEKGIELLIPTREEPAFASVDPVKFPWVVTNIAGNALRYTARGGRIEVGVRVGEGEIEVSVKDTGAGIDPNNLERIFSPYVSLDQKPSPGTHGLGLTIAKEIVEAHGGGIEARSEPGQGTEFRIRVPQQERGS